MQGRVDEGIRFLVDREADWGSDNLFTVHNWWHLALYLLEAGETARRILEIYDAEVHNAKSDGVPLEMVDASALLWRLLLDGQDTGDRFGARSPMPGHRASRRRRGTCSTTCTESWRSWVPVDSQRPSATSRNSRAMSIAMAQARTFAWHR